MVVTPPEEEGLAQSVGEETGHPEMQRRGYQSRGIGGGGEVGAQPLIDEVGHALRWRCLPAVGLQPALTLELFLQCKH